MRHEDGAVRLQDLRGYPPLEGERGLNSSVSFAPYRDAVIDFARTVWELFEDAEKHIVDSEDRRGYAAFCAEYRRRMSSA